MYPCSPPARTKLSALEARASVSRPHLSGRLSDRRRRSEPDEKRGMRQGRSEERATDVKRAEWAAPDRRALRKGRAGRRGLSRICNGRARRAASNGRRTGGKLGTEAGAGERERMRRDGRREEEEGGGQRRKRAASSSRGHSGAVRAVSRSLCVLRPDFLLARATWLTIDAPILRQTPRSTTTLSSTARASPAALRRLSTSTRMRTHFSFLPALSVNEKLKLTSCRRTRPLPLYSQGRPRRQPALQRSVRHHRGQR